MTQQLNTLTSGAPKGSPRPLPPCVCLAALLHSPRVWVVQVVAATVSLQPTIPC